MNKAKQKKALSDNAIQEKITTTSVDGAPKENNHPKILFDKNTTPQVNQPLINPYAFNLKDEQQIIFEYKNLRFTLMGFKPIRQYDSLIASVKVSHNPHINDAYTHIQKIDLFNADKITGYARTASYQLSLSNQDEVKNGLYSLRERLNKYRFDKLKENETTQAPVISTKDKKEALDILKSDNLIECIESLLEQSGVATLKNKALLLFVLIQSRLFAKPLHALLHGSFNVSKMLLKTVSECIPEENLHEQTSMSNSTLYYTRTKDYWKNKVLYAHSLDKQFKGVNTIKEFIDNLKLKRQTTETDYLTRQLYSSAKEVAGPICLLGYTQDENVHQKYLNEALLIPIHESAAVKKEMLNYQQKEFAGLIDINQQQQAKQTLQTISRLIEPVEVRIPFAEDINLPTQVFDPVRSYYQLMTFVKAIALLHQYNLKKHTKAGEKYIEATHEHLELAIELMKEVMVTKSDILTQAQRSFFEKLKQKIKDKDKNFTAKQMMQELRMKRSNFYKLFNVLKDRGMIEKCGGDKKNSEQFIIAEWEDYKELEKAVKAFDKQLKQIKKKFPL